MGGLIGMARRFASTPQGRRAMRQAMEYARSEKGKQQLAQAREKLATGAKARRKPR